jgi:hypothetical protein
VLAEVTIVEERPFTSVSEAKVGGFWLAIWFSAMFFKELPGWFKRFICMT